MSRAARAAAGYILGCLAAVLGLLLLAGPGWALLAAGTVTAASCLLLVDTDETP